MPRSRRTLTVSTLGAVGVGIVALLANCATAGQSHAGQARAGDQNVDGMASTSAAATYTNDVTKGYSIDFPDPAVIRGKDGNWYGYATGGPFDEDGVPDSSYKIAKSPDLVHWEDAGEIFPDGNRPSWATETTGFWAPDVRYLNGQYLLYFSVPDSTASTEPWDTAIGVATAPKPTGPWTPSDKPLIPAERLPDGGWASNIDPALFTDTDGTNYLYWGSYGTGVKVVKLSADGRSVISEPKPIASTRYEGPYVVRHGDWYYLFGSSANCCAGPTTGYSVFAGRAKSPLGPFVDRRGHTLLESRGGGTPVLTQNGNRWIGAGHHSSVIDRAGQEWMTYHAIDRNDPWLDVSPGFTMRPMNIDRLDWIDGWPIVRAGAGPSEDEQAAPVVTGEIDERFESDQPTALEAVEGELGVGGPDPHSGGFGTLSSNASAVSTNDVSDSDVRVEADVRTNESGSVGITGRKAGEQQVRAIVDAERDQLRLESYDSAGAVRRAAAALPAGFDPTAWHTLAIQARGRTVTAEVSDAAQGDPWATVSSSGFRQSAGRAGVLAGGSGAEVDNFSANPLYEPVTELAPTPKPGPVDAAYSDEFDGALDDGWNWLREDPAAKISDGQLVWPTQIGDLVGEGTPGLLLRDMPEGEYTVETKLSIDLGVDTVRNYQQGGLLAYVDDDHFLRFDVVAVGPTRIAEFGKEMMFESRKSWGGALIGAPAETTWLRLVHTLHPKTDEHLFRAASSTDGKHWTWGATWHLPADSTPKLGLVSQGSSAETESQHGPATSEFEYFRVSRP